MAAAQQDKPKVPALRFPEFSREWEEKRLANVIGEIEAGVSVNANDAISTGPHKFILKTSCVFHGRFDVCERKAVTEWSEISRLKRSVRKDDIIVSRMNTPDLVGANGLVQNDEPSVYLPDRLWACRVVDGQNARYVAQHLSSAKMRSSISSVASGTSGSMKNISRPGFLGLLVVYPPEKEQQKIADFLGAVDERLEGLRKRRDLLRDYKRGAMQKIFSQEIRFTRDDGTAFPDWEEKRLGNVVEFSKGKKVSKDDQVDDGHTPCIRYAELYTLYNDVIKSVGKATNLKQDELVLSEIGDVLIPSSGETAEDIGIAACIEIAGVALGGDINILRGASNGRFLAKQLRSSRRNDVMRLAQGQSIVHLYSRDLKTIIVDLPHPDEQKKITDFLSVLDEKIEAVENQITETEAFKKGLLQQMFV